MNMMMPMVLPAAQMRLVTQFSRMAIESQLIIGMRMAGMMGLMPQAPGENFRMIAEKQAAASEAMFAVAKAGMIGASPERMMSAALRPYGKRTRANSRRLTAKKD
ncbi:MULTISPECIES: antibiotic ABC transporter [Paracoccus]|uniref:antibiotic ABC transporter n=1 Tax=Paracoccus TaxID=265 RepID=UPI000A7C3C2B|nr:MULTISPECIES: antibiotic ABC transporter [Paracoccus]